MGLFGTKKHSIGKTIAELRKEKGWTQIELAEKLQVSDKAISKWEKDNGAPSVEFFPALAELFGVSIDYIMTGKKPEPEIIIMSKIELCAKNDDPKLLENFSFNSAHITDENGKSLMYYIKQYKSKKVLTALIDSCGHQTHYMSLFPKREFDLPELLELIKVDRETIVFKNLTTYNQDLRDIADFACGSLWNNSSGQSGVSVGYQNIFKYMVSNYDKLTQNQQDYYFNLNCANIAKNLCWLYAYPYFINEAYKCNKPLFNKLFEKVIKSNNIYLEEADKIRKNNRGDEFWVSQGLKQLCKTNSYIYILEETVLSAINDEDYELAKKLNQYTKVKVDDDVFAQSKIKHNPKLSEAEKSILLCVHYDILDLNELLAINNLKLIKQALNNYPIHYIEIIYNWVKNEQWDKYLKFCEDNNIPEISYYIKRKEDEYVESLTLSALWGSVPSYPQNGKWKLIENQNKNNRFTNIVQHTRAGIIRRSERTIKECIDYLQECRKNIILDISLKAEKEQVVATLTKEYFIEQLNKENIEIVIVKLCVKLEAILKYDYKYDGDFSNMLDTFCTQHCDDEMRCLLNILRKQRNSIVHAEKSEEYLTSSQLMKCIEYINKLG